MNGTRIEERAAVEMPRPFHPVRPLRIPTMTWVVARAPVSEPDVTVHVAGKRMARVTVSVPRGAPPHRAMGMCVQVKPSCHVTLSRHVVLVVQPDFSSHAAAAEIFEVTRLEAIGKRSPVGRGHHGWTAGRRRVARSDNPHVRLSGIRHFSIPSTAAGSLKATRLKPIGKRSPVRTGHHGWTAGRRRVARPNDLRVRLVWLDGIQRGPLVGVPVRRRERSRGLASAMLDAPVRQRRFLRGRPSRQTPRALGDPFAEQRQAGRLLAIRRKSVTRSFRRRHVGRQPT